MTRTVIRWVGVALAILLLLAGANHLAGFIPFTPQWSANFADAGAAWHFAKISLRCRY